MTNTMTVYNVSHRTDCETTTLYHKRLYKLRNEKQKQFVASTSDWLKSIQHEGFVTVIATLPNKFVVIQCALTKRELSYNDGKDKYTADGVKDVKIVCIISSRTTLQAVTRVVIRTTAIKN